MRTGARSLGIAAVTALAAGTLGLQATTAGTQAAPSQTTNRTDSAAGPARAEGAPGRSPHRPWPGFVVTGRVVDPDGTTHVRIDRTYRGLKVLGGDLVVHRGPDGAWRGTSQTLRAPVRVGTTARLARPAGPLGRGGPRAAHPPISGFKAAGTPRLVVDATGSTPHLAWEVVTRGRQADGTPSRLASYVDAKTGKLLRREQQIETVTAPASRSTAARSRCS